VEAFHRAPPAAIAWGRVATAALLLLLLRRALPRSSSRRAWLAAIAFGVALAAMNVCFYLSIARIPLAGAVAPRVGGPVGVALAATGRGQDLVWAGLAAAGVILLGRGFHATSASGVALALAAGCLWAAYLLLGRRVARAWPGTSGLAAGMLAGAVAFAP